MLHQSVITLVLAVFCPGQRCHWQHRQKNQQALPENVPELLVKANNAYAEKDYLTFRKALETLTQAAPLQQRLHVPTGDCLCLA